MTPRAFQQTWQWSYFDEARRNLDFASKALPVVVVQSNTVNSFESMVLCLLSTFDSEGISTRVPIIPNKTNGLKKKSYVMTDKIVTVNTNLLGAKIGKLGSEDMSAISKALAVVLGLSG